MNDYEVLAELLKDIGKNEGCGFRAETLLLGVWLEVPEDSPAKERARRHVSGRETIKAGEAR